MQDPTTKVIKFDEIRARYRQQRRSMIRHIIANQLVGSAINNYLLSQIPVFVKKEDQDFVFEDAMDDLEELDYNYLAAFEIEDDDFHKWLLAKKENTSK